MRGPSLTCRASLSQKACLSPQHIQQRSCQFIFSAAGSLLRVSSPLRAPVHLHPALPSSRDRARHQVSRRAGCCATGRADSARGAHKLTLAVRHNSWRLSPLLQEGRGRSRKKKNRELGLDYILKAIHEKFLMVKCHSLFCMAPQASRLRKRQGHCVVNICSQLLTRL